MSLLQHIPVPFQPSAASYGTGQNKSNNMKNHIHCREVLFYKCCNILRTIHNGLNAQRDMKLLMSEIL